MEKKMNARKKAQRAARLRKQRNRRIALTLCLMFVVAFASIGGTIAWLTAQSGEVTNTFTTADIKIKLIETKNPDGIEVAAGVTNWSAQMIPGKTYSKNPVVSVEPETDVEVYLFVKFTEDVNETYVKYTSLLNSNNGWNPVEGQNDVFYRTVGVNDPIKSWHLIQGDTVTIDSTALTQDNMPASNLTMTYKAYAIQTIGFENNVADAWAEVSKLDNTTT